MDDDALVEEEIEEVEVTGRPEGPPCSLNELEMFFHAYVASPGR